MLPSTLSLLWTFSDSNSRFAIYLLFTATMILMIINTGAWKKAVFCIVSTDGTHTLDDNDCSLLKICCDVESDLTCLKIQGRGQDCKAMWLKYTLVCGLKTWFDTKRLSNTCCSMKFSAFVSWSMLTSLGLLIW